MAELRKFLFDTSFDDLAPLLRADAEVPLEVAPTRAEVEAARAEGLAQGRSAALAEFAARVETRTAEALSSLDRRAGELLAAGAHLREKTEHQALALLRIVLQKAVPALCRKDPATEIEALLARCLGETLDEPRLVLRVNDALFDTMQARLEAITNANGYAGKLVLIADARLAEADCRVEWADGGAERDTGQLLAEIDAIIARDMHAPPLSPKEKVDD